jgi:hypothetical protein
LLKGENYWTLINWSVHSLDTSSVLGNSTH